jgi:hypothetical protein
MHNEQRKLCWALKDELYSCLNMNNEEYTKCRVELSKLQKNCPESWVTRFVDKRKFDKSREREPTTIIEDSEVTRKKLTGYADK